MEEKPDSMIIEMTEMTEIFKDKFTPRFGHTITQYTETLFICFGGNYFYTTNYFYNSVLLIDLENESITELEAEGEMPSTRSGHTGCIYDKKLYIFGGLSDDNSRSFTFEFCNSDVYCFDIETCCWGKCDVVGEQPMHRAWHDSIVVGHMMYVYGGRYGSYKYHSDIWAFDLITHTWTQCDVQGLTILQKAGLSSILLNDNISILYWGGRSQLENPTTAYSHYNNFQIFNTKNMTLMEFETLSDPESLPPPRAGHWSALVDNFLYVGFGYQSRGKPVVFPDCYCFDIFERTWQKVKIASFMTPTLCSAAVAYNNHIFVFGGEIVANQRFSCVQSVYNLNLGEASRSVNLSYLGLLDYQHHKDSYLIFTIDPHSECPVIRLQNINEEMEGDCIHIETHKIILKSRCGLIFREDIPVNKNMTIVCLEAIVEYIYSGFIIHGHGLTYSDMLPLLSAFSLFDRPSCFIDSIFLYYAKMNTQCTYIGENDIQDLLTLLTDLMKNNLYIPSNNMNHSLSRIFSKLGVENIDKFYLHIKEKKSCQKLHALTEQNLLSDFSTAINEKDNLYLESSDFSLKCENTVIPVHKCILAQRWPYFSALSNPSFIEENFGFIPGVSEDGISPESLNSFLLYLYSGQIDFSLEDSCYLLRMAEYFCLNDPTVPHLNKLVKHCEKAIEHAQEQNIPIPDFFL